MYTVYKFTSPSWKSYVGVTTRDINHRLNEHKKSAENDIKTWFADAIRKYGFENFKFEILRNDITDKKFLAAAEIFYISFCNSFYYGYNMDRGGKGIGRVVKVETRELLSKSRKKYIKENPNKIKECAIKVSKKVDQKAKGQKISETKRKNNSGNNNASSSTILIYDNNDNLIHKSEYNFKEYCEMHNLPYIRFCRSYQRNTKMTNEFKGWYAIKIKWFSIIILLN